MNPSLPGSTLPTTDPVASSLRDRMRRSREAGQYQAASAVQIIAKEFGKPASVAAQMLKYSDSRCPVSTLTRMVAALQAGGRGDAAARLLLPLDIVRSHVKPRELAEVIPDAQHADLLEDLAENEARSFPDDLDAQVRWLAKMESAHLRDAEEIVALRANIAARRGHQ